MTRGRRIFADCYIYIAVELLVYPWPRTPFTPGKGQPVVVSVRHSPYVIHPYCRALLSSRSSVSMKGWPTSRTRDVGQYLTVLKTRQKQTFA